ncbi:hypothetical protein [Streptomyces sp. NPDC050546]|uniref:hypothetical protein n=1 Tax=Streptomyces sp. NPDC050546 TaxID=3365628 RepID=UPI00379C51C4
MLGSGYDAPRITHLLGNLPVQTLGRLRTDRFMRRPGALPRGVPPGPPGGWPTAQARRRVRLR